MRDINRARTGFHELKQHKTLRELKQAVRLNDSTTSIATDGARSACWKAFLLFETLDVSTWQHTLSSSRSAYNSLRAHFLRHLENPDEAEASYDPLNADTDASPWVQLRKDEELRAEILQDVIRCMPENLYFRQPDTQRMLLDVLFVFCKLNPDISYRQGMHELLAPILWVVERDAIDLGQTSKVMGEDAVISSIFDSNYVESDTFALFGQMMQSAKNFYEQTTTSGKENPIVARSRRIFNELLPKVDEDLAKHLESIEILPQIFLMRWIRLLFGREFAYDQMLTMWDVIFAEDPTLDIVNEICVAMLLRIRWQLLESNYNAALSLLLRYPQIDADFSAQTFVVDALFLRDHLDRYGGSSLVFKYTGRTLSRTGRPATPPALQRNLTTVSVSGAANRGAKSRPQSAYASSPRDINKVIQSTAKELYARGEKLGIGKAVRNAVDEVQKRAQEIRDAQTPSPPVIHRRQGSYSSVNSDALFKRIRALEDRNKGLAKLLEGAVAELWAFQKTVSESSQQEGMPSNSSDVEGLSAAIAKAQFVQVYLDDPTLPLSADPRDEESKEKIPTPISSPSGNRLAVQGAPGETDPSIQESIDGDIFSKGESLSSTSGASQTASRGHSVVQGNGNPPSLSQSSTEVPDIIVDTAVVAQTAPQANFSTRARLEQSSFSWMLDGQEASTSTPVRPPPFVPKGSRGKGFLFGDEAR